MKRFGRCLRGISPVLAVLMMIAVAIAGALVTYAWVMGYIGFQTEKSGSSIQIHSIANQGADLLVYVQNVGENVVQLDEDSCLYVNGILVPCDITNVSVTQGTATLGLGETATLRYAGGAALSGEKVHIKVTTILGISAENSAYPAGSASDSSGVSLSDEWWNRTYEASDFGGACSLIATSDGGYAIAGSIFGSGPEPNIFWLVKLDEFGNVEWRQTYEGGSSCHALVEAVDGGYALLGIASRGGGHDFYLVRTNESGGMLWYETYGGPESNDAYSIVATSDGGFAIAGETFSFDNGESAFWLVKVDASGGVQWNETYGGTGYDRPYSLVVTSDGGYALAGKTGSAGDGHAVGWLVKTNASGTAEWGELYAGEGESWVYSLIVSSDGGYVMAGDTRTLDTDFNDFWLVKTNSSGAVEWNQTYVETDMGRAESVVETSDGGYILIGQVTSFISSNNGWLLVKTDASGNMAWNQTYSASSCLLAPTSDGGYALACITGNTFYMLKTDELTKPE